MSEKCVWIFFRARVALSEHLLEKTPNSVAYHQVSYEIYEHVNDLGVQTQVETNAGWRHHFSLQVAPTIASLPLHWCSWQRDDGSRGKGSNKTSFQLHMFLCCCCRCRCCCCCCCSVVVVVVVVVVVLKFGGFQK